MAEEGYNIKSDKNLKPQNLISLLASNKLCQHQHPTHPWNKAYPETESMLLTPNPALNNGIGCNNEASNQSNA